MVFMNLKTVFYDWYGWNRSLFEAINGGLPESAGFLAQVGSALGSYWAAPLMLAALAIWARWAGAQRRSGYAERIATQAQRFGWACLLALVVASLLKWGFDMARPATALGAATRVLAPVDPRHSFPSGHAVYAALVLVALWPLANKFIRPLLIVTLLWAGWGRIAMGAHFPADVLGGWLVGMLCFQTVAAFTGRSKTSMKFEKTS
jgi:signal peptidase II